jgi:5-methylcytosine-specific restriction protein A
MALILSEDWSVTRRGQKSKGYNESRAHIRLVEEDGFKLMTFPMEYSNTHREDDEDGPAKIGGFTPELSEKRLTRVGKNWYAADYKEAIHLAEELSTPEKYSEGAKFSVTINAYERNPKARAACIAHYGHVCAVCGFDFSRVYGSLGEGFIHVHHIIPIGQIGEQYEINPITDLVPVCPNCHAMIHRMEPPLTIEELRKHIHERTDYT